MVVIDTSVIIDHLRQAKAGETLLMKLAKRVSKQNLAISVISVQELYEGQSTKDLDKENFMLATITPLKILPYTYEAAQLGGEIARDLSKPIELADAAIAATCVVNGAQLITLNEKDFRDIVQLELLKLPA